MRKKLYKSNSQKMVCGVCGGIAEYFDIDPTLVRLLWAVVTLLFWVGILAYAAAIIMPTKPMDMIDMP